MTATSRNERTEKGLPPDLDANHVIEALARVSDPTLRYFLWLFIDLVTERIAQLEQVGQRGWVESFAREQ